MPADDVRRRPGDVAIRTDDVIVRGEDPTPPPIPRVVDPGPAQRVECWTCRRLVVRVEVKSGGPANARLVLASTSRIVAEKNINAGSSATLEAGSSTGSRVKRCLELKSSVTSNAEYSKTCT